MNTTTKLQNNTLTLWNGPTASGFPGFVRRARPSEASITGQDGPLAEFVVGRSQGWVGPRDASYQQFDSYIQFTRLRPGVVITRHGLCGSESYRIRGSKSGLFAERIL